jgi:hypothetical protein
MLVNSYESESPFAHLRELLHVRVLFRSNQDPNSFASIVKWWEWRRITYNVVLLILGIVSTYIYWTLFDKYAPDPADDGIFPGLMPIIVGIVANFFYTSGWTFEILLRLIRGRGSKRLAPALFGLGLGFSMLVVSVPAISALVLTTHMHSTHHTHWPQ